MKLNEPSRTKYRRGDGWDRQAERAQCVSGWPLFMTLTTQTTRQKMATLMNCFRLSRKVDHTSIEKPLSAFKIFLHCFSTPFLSTFL